MSNLSKGLQIVFADTKYVLLVAILSVTIAVLFSISMGVLLINPILFFNYFEFFEDGPVNIALNFVYVLLMPVLASTTIAISIYKFFSIKKGISKEGATSVFGFASAAFVTTCSNCVPVALYSIGITYGLFQAVFAPFVLPFKLLTIAIISLSFYFATTSLGQLCKLKKTRR